MHLSSFFIGALGLIIFLWLLAKPVWDIHIWIFKINILAPLYTLAWTSFTLPYIPIHISLAIILLIISVILLLIGITK